MTKAKFFAKLAKLMARYPDYSQAESEDPFFVVKLFDIAWSGTWYLSEYNPETHIAFGYVTGLAFDEWWTVSLDELADLGWFCIPRIEIDKFFKKTRSSVIINAENA